MYYYANIYGLGNICEHVFGIDTPAFHELRLWAHSSALQAIQDEVRQVLQQQKRPHDTLIRSIVLLAANKLQHLEHEDGLQMLIEKRGGVSTRAIQRSLSCTRQNLNLRVSLTLAAATSLYRPYCKDLRATQSHISRAFRASYLTAETSLRPRLR